MGGFACFLVFFLRFEELARQQRQKQPCVRQCYAIFRPIIILKITEPNL